MLVGVVTAEVASGFVVDQPIFELQLLAPETIVQLEAVRVPNITGVAEKVAETVQALVIAPVV
jgi:hypothetical protein